MHLFPVNHRSLAAKKENAIAALRKVEMDETPGRDDKWTQPWIDRIAQALKTIIGYLFKKEEDEIKIRYGSLSALLDFPTESPHDYQKDELLIKTATKIRRISGQR